MPALPFNINTRRIAVFAGIFILALVMIELNSRLEELNRLDEQLSQAQIAATHSMQTQVVFQTQVAHANSDAAVAEWARDEAGYMQTGDQPVIPIGQDGSDPVIVATPLPTPTPMQNWQIWQNLFFGQ